MKHTLTPPTSFPANYRTVAGEEVIICAYDPDLYYPYYGHFEGGRTGYMWNMHGKMNGSNSHDNRLVDPPRTVTVAEHWVAYRSEDGEICALFDDPDHVADWPLPDFAIIHHPAREVEV